MAVLTCMLCVHERGFGFDSLADSVVWLAGRQVAAPPETILLPLPAYLLLGFLPSFLCLSVPLTPGGSCVITKKRQEQNRKGNS